VPEVGGRFGDRRNWRAEGLSLDSEWLVRRESEVDFGSRLSALLPPILLGLPRGTLPGPVCECSGDDISVNDLCRIEMLTLT
jgi:hypothetical protein